MDENCHVVIEVPGGQVIEFWTDRVTFRDPGRRIEIGYVFDLTIYDTPRHKKEN